MSTVLSFNVDHWSWLSADEQQLTAHESRDFDIDELVDTTIISVEDMLPFPDLLTRSS